MTDFNKSKRLKFSEKRKIISENKKIKKKKKSKFSDKNTVSPSQKQLNSLLQCYQNGQLHDAEKLAISMTQNFPEHQFGWKVLAVILKVTGRVSESLVANQKSVQLNLQDPEAHNNLGGALRELGRLHEAEASCKQALLLNPGFYGAHTNLGTIFQSLGKIDEAEASYRKAIELKVDFPDAHNNLGLVLEQSGNVVDAEASYRKAIELKSDYAEAHNNLGNVLLTLEKLDGAEVSFRQAIKLKNAFASAHNNLGLTLQTLGRRDEAVASFRQAIVFKSNIAYVNLGSVLRELGRPEDAEESYLKAISLNSSYAQAYFHLGIFLQELGRLEEAETRLRQAIALNSDYAEAHSNLGGTLRALGQIDEAEASYRQAIAIEPESAEAKHFVAALSGETTNSPPRDYVEGLFDSYAARFDTALVDSLEYKLPRRVAEISVKNNNGKSLGSVLDLGCGTGLVGLEVRKFCEYLEGVDLSNKMLDQARGKNIYDKLTYRDIVDYLATERLDFDYFISMDTFIYVGDLNAVFESIKSRNKSGGKLIFSTENTEKDGFFLERSGRYSHSKQYIRSLCEKFDYKLCCLENINLRKEGNQYITGNLYLLDF